MYCGPVVLKFQVVKGSVYVNPNSLAEGSGTFMEMDIDFTALEKDENISFADCCKVEIIHL